VVVHGGEEIGTDSTRLYSVRCFMLSGIACRRSCLCYESQCSRGDINCVHKPVYLPGCLIQSCITQTMLLHQRQFCWWFWRLCIRGWTS